ncbi:hypothetical protein DICPUDRAFT_147987 [Dictyostelium purpureum]|uniref:Lebercilin domain-containing protein n=1 Tax=Dictyostelium purpureum TaxID=5786 RepID=F0Z9Y3_DICPU|nr:uncharacterized protein DICPUDRAFT_147987 [Dictyostelium purpureum]EGC39198.1 hypothetical protein DICPUDRAFT_147987 [Dictyostelium purpureum]|eukprot:XP_003284225.1 hypothetical protein DICPUDRAFT_147987 [Dictyostelium purpureum]
MNKENLNIQRSTERIPFSNISNITRNDSIKRNNSNINNQIDLRPQIENANNKIKELEEQLKSKNVEINDLKTKNSLLLSIFYSNRNDRQEDMIFNNNRIRKIQELTNHNQVLLQQIQQIENANETFKDRTTTLQSNHRVRLIQKLKCENKTLKDKLQHQELQLQKHFEESHTLSKGKKSLKQSPIKLINYSNYSTLIHQNSFNNTPDEETDIYCGEC